MKLLKKYSKEINEETKVYLEEILVAIRSVDERTMSILIDYHCRKAKTNAPKSYHLTQEVEKLKSMEFEDAINMLYSLCQGTQAGLVIVGLTSIVNMFSADTFKYIESSFDFTSYEKETKSKLNKFALNKSEEKHKSLELAIEVLSEKVNTYKITPSKMYSFLLEGKYVFIAHALSEEFKENKTEMKNLTTMLSVALDSSLYKSIKTFLGLKNPQELKSNESHEEVVEKLMSSPYRQIERGDNNSIYKVKRVLEESEAFVHAVLEGSNTISFCIEAEHFATKEIHYFNCQYRWWYSSVVEVKLSDVDWEFMQSGNRTRGVTNVSVDTSYSALERNKSYSNKKEAEFSAYEMGYLKNWLRKYNPNNLIGSVVEIEVECNFRMNTTAYAVIDKIIPAGEGLEIVYLVPNLGKGEVYFLNCKERHVGELKPLDKDEALVFYQDMLHILQMKTLTNFRSEVYNSMR